MKARYKTITELKEAIDSGKVPKDIEVTLDNDCAFVYLALNEYDIEYLWYGDGPHACAKQALDALGLKWGHV